MKYYKRPFKWVSVTGTEFNYAEDNRYFKVLNGLTFEWDHQNRRWYPYGTINDLELSGMNLEEISEQDIFLDLL